MPVPRGDSSQRRTIDLQERRDALRATLREARALLPEGRGVSDEVWASRHRGILVLLWLHTVGLAVFGVLTGNSLVHSVGEAALVGLAATLAASGWLSRMARAVVASVGLVTASAVLVHLSGGYVEMHFHFFVVVAIIALYQAWIPFSVAIGYTAIHHGVVGVLAPQLVFNHPAAWEQPWLWALIHAAFVLAASVAALVAWRLSEYQALHDPLTHAANRALFFDRLGQALSRASRSGKLVAVLYVDLDDFKPVNDRFGHGVGDTVLKTVVGRLQRVVRDTDTVARLGGDEFAVLLEDAGSSAYAALVANRILKAVCAPITVAGGEVLVGASIGLATSAGHERSDELLRRADAAMYAAKRTGKGNMVTYEPALDAVLVPGRAAV